MMHRPAMIGGPTRATHKTAARSVACLGFVGLMSAAFWAGALWIGETLVRILAAG